MKLIVGLGNPGEEYSETRHNVGYMFIDYISNLGKLPHEYRFLKPNTYMNNSGEEVAREMQYYRLSAGDIIVVHDDLDIPLGMWKHQVGVGPKLHNGVESVEKHVKTKDFVRIRVGIENRSEKIPGDVYVLQRFNKEELEKLQVVFKEIVERTW